MNENKMDELMDSLVTIVNEVSQGNDINTQILFELTNADKYPQKIVTLAESFGMMFVRIEAKQQHLERLIDNLEVKKKELELVASQLLSANTGILEVLGNAIAKRDSDTCSHNYRVTIHAIHLGKKLGFDNNALNSLIKGSFLHDIGKIAISDTILLKPGKLTYDEFEVMKTHSLQGSDIISSYEWLKDAEDVVLHHHERFDGSGYPHGLRGERIPFNARIFALADVFDALTSKRPYKEPFSFDMTIEIMTAGEGSHFDPELFRVFCESAEEMHENLANRGEPSLTEELKNLMQLCTEKA